MNRALTIRNIKDKKHQVFEFDGEMLNVFGKPSQLGFWLIYGKEKNGKTQAALTLAEYFSKFKKVLYVSAEEGLDLEFKQAILRTKLSDKANINFIEYEPLEELEKRLKKHKSPDIVFVDNLTIYNSEFKNKGVYEFKKSFEKKLFVFVAHEERNQPYTASANMVSKLAKVIINVKGLEMHVGGRVPGGKIVINEQKKQLYHGTK